MTQTFTPPPYSDASLYSLREYLLRITTTRCLHCHAEHTTSEALAVYTHATLTAGSAARKLVAVSDFARGPLPIGITKLPPRTQPFCHRCYQHLPTSQLRPHSTDASWAHALQADAIAQRGLPTSASGELRRTATPGASAVARADATRALDALFSTPSAKEPRP